MDVMKNIAVAIAAAIGGVAILVGAVAGCVVWWYESTETRPVGATATFEESADCLVRYNNNILFGTWKLNTFYVAQCFPRQTAAKKRALIACFNAYERNHPYHKGWPEDNMRGCTWDRVADVGSLAFRNVVAVPAVPRAGKRFVLKVGVTLVDSAAEIVDAGIGTTFFHGQQPFDVAVRIDGENLVTVVAVSTDGENLLDTTLRRFSYGFSPDGKMYVTFTVPKSAAGKRLAIKLTIADDTPAATKTVAFTVDP